MPPMSRYRHQRPTDAFSTEPWKDRPGKLSCITSGRWIQTVYLVVATADVEDAVDLSRGGADLAPDAASSFDRARVRIQDVDVPSLAAYV